ncbi:MAG: SLBB domain-containing protein [Marinilabiliaceae bacterium]|nr:SLBB domain-containing protein [Marinilabiliaceae bacterium]
MHKALLDKFKYSLTLSFLLGTILCFVCPSMTAQVGNLKTSNTKISELSDEQIDRIIREIEEKNLTTSQAKTLAKTRGASDKQVQELEERIMKRREGSFSNNSTYTRDGSSSSNSFDGISKKNAEILFTKEDSLVFGFAIFNNSKLSFEPNVNTPVSDSYILGPGDELIIDIFGQSQQNYSNNISSTGSIDIPMLGPIYVGGQSLSTARQTVISRLKTIYSDLGNRTSASIKLGKLRTINVSVMGEVFVPGTYTISGASSLFNILYLSGGPNKNGSFRDVQLLREGKVIAHLDVYDLILNGNTEVNVALRDGDIVMIPTYQKRITVNGAFKRKGYFEAKEGESTDDIIKYAGGFEPNANTNNIQLTRISSKGGEFKSIHIGEAIPVMNGDILDVSLINQERVNNVVNISGAVFLPGNYEYTKGLTLYDLVKRAGGITEDAFVNRGIITRLKDDRSLESSNFNVADLVNGRFNINLRSNDSVYISPLDSVRTRRTIDIRGNVRKPCTIDYREGLTVGDAILLAGGLTDIASPQNVEVFRRLTEEQADTAIDTHGIMQSIGIKKDLRLDDEGCNFVLQPFDIISVREYRSASSSGVVTISGEIAFAGPYALTSKDETILSLIRRAGGFTKYADINAARLYRMVLIDEKMKAIRREQQDLFAIDGKKSTVNLKTQDGYELVAIDLKDILNNSHNNPDIHLMPGDEIVIPTRTETVRVNGQVLNPVSVSYMGNVSARKYIMSAGGFSSTAKKNKTFVIYPNGKAVATKNFLFFRKYPKVVPGSEVIVPEKPEREKMSPTAVVSLSSTLLTMAVVIVNLIK